MRSCCVPSLLMGKKQDLGGLETVGEPYQDALIIARAIARICCPCEMTSGGLDVDVQRES